MRPTLCQLRYSANLVNHYVKEQPLHTRMIRCVKGFVHKSSRSRTLSEICGVFLTIFPFGNMVDDAGFEPATRRL